MTPAFKAHLAFLKFYPKAINMTNANYDASLVAWWEANKQDHPRATFEDLKRSIDATIIYNRSNPDRGKPSGYHDPIFQLL